MANLRKTDYPIRLNKYISVSGYCSRRKADIVVFSGLVKINNHIVKDPFYRVNDSDKVFIDNKLINITNEKYYYIVLNKPKDYIVTNNDEHNRKTVFDLLTNFKEEVRLFAVGRLDRNTTGVLILTNDGLLSNKLTHPSTQVPKEYFVTLDRKLIMPDIDAILTGVPLDDGISKFDSIDFVDNIDKKSFLLTIHSGKNRIIRRTFEALNYVVKNLDRISFAGINKSKLHPGKWRFLSEKELLKIKAFLK